MGQANADTPERAGAQFPPAAENLGKSAENGQKGPIPARGASISPAAADTSQNGPFPAQNGPETPARTAYSPRTLVRAWRGLALHHRLIIVQEFVYLTIFLAACIFLSTACQGAAYVGADYGLENVAWSGSLFTGEPQHFGAGDIHLGWQFGPHFGAEAGYTDGSASQGANQFSLRGPTLDGYAYAPFGQGRFAGFLTLGAADLRAASQSVVTTASGKITTRVTTSLFRATAWDWRAGGGLRWNVTPSTFARLTLRYDAVTAAGLRGGMSLSAGLNFGL